MAVRSREQCAGSDACPRTPGRHLRGVGRRSSARRARLIVVGFALLGAACGSTTAKAPSPATSPLTSSAAGSSPTLTVSPSSGLVGGQQLHVSVAGFPHNATVQVYECASVPPAGSASGCGRPAATGLFTGPADTASGLFTAQPAAATPVGPTTPCHAQCVLVATVIKVGAATPPNPAPTATTPLLFSATAPAALVFASLQDLSWVSTTDG